MKMGKVAKKKRDENLSAPNPEKCPKAWEKARRDRMKVLFDELSRLLPKFDPAVPPSRPEIIQKAMAYIRDLQAQNEDLLNGGFDEVYKQKIETWKLRVKELLSRVEQLTGILRTANIHVPPLALQGIPAWTKNRPKFWTEKVNIPERKVEEVLKQLSQGKKKTKSNGNVKRSRIFGKLKKLNTEKVNEIQCKENHPTDIFLNKNSKSNSCKSNQSVKLSAAVTSTCQILPLTVPSPPTRPTTVTHSTQSLLQENTVTQSGTFILTNQGNLLPVITPNAGILTPVLINRPPPLLVLQTPPQPQSHSLPVIISRPPPNKRRIERESTVMTFSNKRPISALSKHSHPRRGGKCAAHKTSNRDNANSTCELQPVLSSSAPAVSPTAAFLNSFPVVATPKIMGTDEEDSDIVKPGEPSKNYNTKDKSVSELNKPCNNEKSQDVICDELSESKETQKKEPTQTSQISDSVPEIQAVSSNKEITMDLDVPSLVEVPTVSNDGPTFNSNSTSDSSCLNKVANESKAIVPTSSENITHFKSAVSDCTSPTSQTIVSHSHSSDPITKTSQMVTSSALNSKKGESNTLTNAITSNVTSPLVNVQSNCIGENSALEANRKKHCFEKFTTESTAAVGFNFTSEPTAVITGSSTDETRSTTIAGQHLNQPKVSGTSTCRQEEVPTSFTKTCNGYHSVSHANSINNNDTDKRTQLSNEDVNQSSDTASMASCAEVATSNTLSDLRTEGSSIQHLDFNTSFSKSISEETTSMKFSNSSLSVVRSSNVQSSSTSNHLTSWNLPSSNSIAVTDSIVTSFTSSSDYVVMPNKIITNQEFSGKKVQFPNPISVNSLTARSSDYTSTVGTVPLPSSWAPVPIMPKISSHNTDSSLPIHPPLLTSTVSSQSDLHNSQNSWLPIPTVYSSDKFNNFSVTSTWRPIPADQVWTNNPQSVGENWKMASSPQSSQKTLNPFETGRVTTGIEGSKAASAITTTALFSKVSCETTWSSGIMTPAYATNVSLNTSTNVSLNTSTSQVNSVKSSYSSLPQQIRSSFTSTYTPNVHPSQSLIDQNNPWNNCNRFKPFNALPPNTKHENTSENFLQTHVEGMAPSVSTKQVSTTSLASLTRSADGYTTSEVKVKPAESVGAGSNSSLQIVATIAMSSSQAYPNSTPPKMVMSKSSTSVNMALPNSTLCNPFTMSAYTAPIINNSATNNSNPSNFGSTFANDTSYSSKPSFPLDVPKALFPDPPYSLTVPKTPVSEFFSNVPMYQTTSSNLFPPQPGHFPNLSVSKTFTTLSNPSEGISAFPSSGVSSGERLTLSSGTTKASGTDAKDLASPLNQAPPATFKNQRNDLVEHKFNNAPAVSKLSTSSVNSKSTGIFTHKQTISDISTSIWNSPYFPQSTPVSMVNDVGASWNQLDIPFYGDGKESRPKPPINWMTEADQVEDPFQSRFSNILDKKDSQASHNILDFCFNSLTEDDNVKNRSRKKDTDHCSQDYFGWMSMKVDSLVVPCTLPTLVGDLALGSDPIPSKRNKTTPGPSDANQSARKVVDGSNVVSQEPFANLSKNIFDISQGEPNKGGNIPETIVLKNIFELPSVPDGKVRNSQNQNTFLSVSQLVEPSIIDNTHQKSDYTYYSQRSGKGKRGSGWKCGEKKCQQNAKSCNSYSAEALLRSNDALPMPMEQDFPLPGPSSFPLEFQHDPTVLTESADISAMNHPGKQKTYIARSRKHDYWKGPDLKSNQPLSNVPQNHISPSKVELSQKPSDLSLSYPNIADGRLSVSQHSNLHFSSSVSSTGPYTRFPGNPVTPFLPEFKAEGATLPPASPGRPCQLPADTGYLPRYPGPRKSCIHPRSNAKTPFSYSFESQRKMLTKTPIGVHHSPNSSSSVNVTYTKPPIQPTPDAMLAPPISITGIISSKSSNILQSSNVGQNSLLSSVGTYPMKSPISIQQSPNSLGLNTTVSMHQSSNPMLGSASPIPVSRTYLSKPTVNITHSPQTINVSSGMAQQPLNQVLNSPLTSAGTYPSFPPLPPHTPGSSSNSLANFNLTTIFPEMNKKTYQYT